MTNEIEEMLNQMADTCRDIAYLMPAREFRAQIYWHNLCKKLEAAAVTIEHVAK